MAAHRSMESFYPGTDLEPDWEWARRFHGHLGPWLALGMRMGEEARKALQTRPHFGLRVHAQCPLQPPTSCLIDGLQWMTGATFGKQNLTAAPSDPIQVRFEAVDGSGAVTIRLREGVAERMTAWFDEMGDEAASYHVYGQPADALFLVERRSG
ncbi:MAG: formylmethanofuran dehydrogenase subunit E [Chthonomonadales bacterium]|nr:formylmethanofuran dehydrogenase subunit E [Chthonomonadales bacterium]